MNINKKECKLQVKKTVDKDFFKKLEQMLCNHTNREKVEIIVETRKQGKTRRWNICGYFLEEDITTARVYEIINSKILKLASSYKCAIQNIDIENNGTDKYFVRIM